MQFPLADADLTAFAFAVFGFEFGDVGGQFFEVVDAVVGDADGADLTGGLGFDEGAPGAETAVTAAVGGVDEVAGGFVSFTGAFHVQAWGFSGVNRGSVAGNRGHVQVYVIESGFFKACGYTFFGFFIAHVLGVDFCGEEEI